MSFNPSISTICITGGFSDTLYFYNKKERDEQEEISKGEGEKQKRIISFESKVCKSDISENAGVQIHGRNSLIGLISWLFNRATYIKESGIYVNNDSMSRFMYRICVFNNFKTLPNEHNVLGIAAIKIKTCNKDVSKELFAAKEIFVKTAKEFEDEKIDEIFDIMFRRVNMIRDSGHMMPPKDTRTQKSPAPCTLVQEIDFSKFLNDVQTCG